MQREQTEAFRRALLELRQRITGEVKHVEESIREDSPPGGLSHAPVHLADVAGDGIDADVEILETERGILKEIDAALDRLEDGTFGICQECGARISHERLTAIPYAAHCIACAREAEGSSATPT
jgi:RNA polymerase-binding protein DksA